VLLAIVGALADALVLALVLALIEVGAEVWLVTLVDPDAVVGACPYVTATKAKHDTSERYISSCKELNRQSPCGRQRELYVENQSPVMQLTEGRQRYEQCRKGRGAAGAARAMHLGLSEFH
jgi:hypothetical protein